MLYYTGNRPSNKTNWVETNDESRGTYKENNQIRFKSSSLCDYSNAYKLVKETITVENRAVAASMNNATNKKVILKNCVRSTIRN